MAELDWNSEGDIFDPDLENLEEPEVPVEKQSLLERLKSRSFDPTGELEPIHFNIKRKDENGIIHNFARNNNIILIKGKPGTRKSTFARAFTSGVYNDKYSMGFSFEDKGGVIFVDAEQDKATYHACQMEMYTLAGWSLDRKRDEYYPYIVTPDPIQDKFAMVELMLQIHKDAKYLVIDQLAAFCQNYNDTSEAEHITSRIKTWAFDYNITIIIVMHTNFTSDKANGALGSETEKISNTALWLQEDNGGTKITNTKIRGAKKLKEFWIYHDDNGLPTMQDSGGLTW